MNFPLQRKPGYDNGIFLDNIEQFIDESVLQVKLSKKNIEGITNIKVPRNHQSRVVRGYAFVGFETEQQAIDARIALNYGKIFTNEIRVSLISQSIKQQTEQNILVTNLPVSVTGQEFDREMSKYGVVSSSKIQYKNDKVTSKGMGYVQFKNQEDAQKFRDLCEKQEVVIGENKLGSFVFKPRDKNQTDGKETSSIYLRDYQQAQYSAEQINDEAFINAEKQKIHDYLQEQLSKHGKVDQISVSFNKQFRKPFVFASFEKLEEAQNAVVAIKNDSEFHFKHVNIQLTSKISNRDPRCIYVKNLKKNVTEANIMKVFTEDLKTDVISICIKNHPDYQKTNYAIIFLKEDNKLSYLKNALTSEQYKCQALIDLFDSRPYIGNAFPQAQHAQYLKSQYFKKQTYGNQQFSQHRNTYMPYPMQFPMMMPHMMPMMPNMMPMQQVNSAPNQAPPGMIQPNQNFQQMQMMNQQQRPYQQRNNNYRSQGPRQNNYQNNQNRQYSQGGQQQRNYNNRPQQSQQSQQQQQRKPQQQGKQPQKYVPKVAPKLVAAAGGKAPQAAKPQASQPGQITIQSLEAKWDSFKALAKPQQVQMLGSILLPKVQNLCSQKQNVGKIVGMLVDLSNFTIEEVRDLIKDQEQIRERVKEAEELFSENN